MEIQSIEAPKGGPFLVLLFVLGIFGLGLFLFGAVQLLFNGMQNLLGLITLLTGLLMGPGLIALGIYLERRKMEAFRAEILRTHPNILIRFKDQKRQKEVVFIPEGVFVAEYFYAFDGKAMRMGREGLELKNGLLEMHLESFKGMKAMGRMVRVFPPKELLQLPSVLKQLNQKYLNQSQEDGAN
jgi:hypothetical protein